MERSLPEKELLVKITREQAELPYHILTHYSDQYGNELYYDIPDDKKAEELKKAWPFTETPKMEDALCDIHSKEIIEFKDCLILRWNNRNIIVSPHYFTSGGTCLDLMSTEKDFQVRIMK